ncbi:MAG: hypothetical protein A2283_17290 [Lentisphaerae bacterium RIFOXYA12_FULL_48_11]|nr:MAG: hypothetical protein A2283_17290 [Lentisphaerae bacterium RIFOXYA12_FULL_48_11]
MFRGMWIGILLVVSASCLSDRAGAEVDPYLELVSFDFGSTSTAPAMIEKEFRDGGPDVYRKVEAKLLAVLAKPEITDACRKTVCEDLRIIGSALSVKPLSVLLADEKTADLARLALESIPGRKVDSILLKTLKSCRGRKQIGIIQTLATRRNPKLADVLKGYLSSDNTDLIRASLHALARVGGEDALMVLKSAELSGEFQPLRELAMMDAVYNLAANGGRKKALAIFEHQYKAGTYLPAVISAFNGLIDYGPDPVSIFAAALKDQRKLLALAAAKASMRMTNEGIAKILCEAFSSVQPEVQIAIVRALAERGDRVGLPVIRSAMVGADKVVQAEAVAACEKIGDVTVVNDLMVLAMGGMPGAQQALSRLNDAEVNGLLVKLLDDPDPAKVRIAAIGLKLRDDLSALPRLMKMAESDKSELRTVSFEALEGFAGENEIPSLIALLGKTSVFSEQDRIASILWKATRLMENEDARFRKLWGDVGSCSDQVKVAVLPLASAAGGAEPIKVVVDFLGAESEVIKDRAARTLFKWPNDEAVKPLVNLIKESNNSKYKILGMQAVVRILTDKRCKEPIKQRVETLNEILPLMERPEDRQSVQSAITRINDSQGKK